MARPCKPIETQSRHNTKEEIEARKKQEERKKGKRRIVISTIFEFKV